MASILAPVSASAYKNGHVDYFGAVELDAETGETVWRFDATDPFTPSSLYQSGEVVKRTGFRPASVQRLDDGRTLVSGWRRLVVVDEDGAVDETCTHELFNDVHETQQLDGGHVLVASTGMDTLVLLDENFEELWRWHMWEHVGERTRPGQYYPDQLWYRDARDLALNPDDRYHLNYATVLSGSVRGGDATLLCSALNYGIFTVDMGSGAITHEFTALDECHNPYATGDGFVVPESGADRVVVVDWNGHRKTLFDEGLSFVKDADPVGDGDWLLADTKHDRVLLWNEANTAPTTEFDLGRDANPYEADYLTGEDSFA